MIEYIPEAERESDSPTVIKMKFVPYSMVEQYAKIIERKAAGAVRGVKDAQKRIELKMDIVRETQKRQF